MDYDDYEDLDRKVSFGQELRRELTLHNIHFGFYSHFTSEEVIFITKEFKSWIKLEADDRELSDNITSALRKLVNSKKLDDAKIFETFETTEELVFFAYEDFKEKQKSRKESVKF
tara:strand:+ start:964 stop:1308 length:345 start_codon:yes stop_codon:yes gene_type:complete